MLHYLTFFTWAYSLKNPVVFCFHTGSEAVCMGAIISRQSGRDPWQGVGSAEKGSLPQRLLHLCLDCGALHGKQNTMPRPAYFWLFSSPFCHCGQVGKAAITSSLCLRRYEVLRSLRHYLQAQSKGHFTSIAWRREV